MTDTTMEYRGYAAHVTYSAGDGCLVGRLLGITDVVDFHGDSVEEIRREMKLAVDEYIKACEKTGSKPQVPFSGKILLRAPPPLHAAIIRAALAMNVSANQLMVDILSKHLDGILPSPDAAPECRKNNPAAKSAVARRRIARQPAHI